MAQHTCIEYKILTEKYHTEAIELLETSFYPFEPISIAFGIPQNPKAMAELNSLAINAAKKFSTSLVAIDSATDKVVGVAFHINKTKQTTNGMSYFRKYGLEHFTQKESIAYINLDNPIYRAIFDTYNVTRIMEGLFIAVSYEYRKQKIGMELMRQGVKLFHTLSKLPDGPQLFLSEFTSEVSQKMGLSLNFEFIDSNDSESLKQNFVKLADENERGKLCSKHGVLKIN